MKAKKNKTVEEQLPDMQMTVAERRHVCKATGNNHFSSLQMQLSEPLSDW